MTELDRYPRQIFWSDEDDGYIAMAQDLPGCSAFGETESQALSQLRDAIAAWVEAARNAGNVIPEPSRPSVEPQASGKFLLRMPRSLHAQLVQEARRDNVSLNQFVVYLLTTAHMTRNLSADAILQSAPELLENAIIQSMQLSETPFERSVRRLNQGAVLSGSVYDASVGSVWNTALGSGLEAGREIKLVAEVAAQWPSQAYHRADTSKVFLTTTKRQRAM